jgi:hypothetical protein
MPPWTNATRCHQRHTPGRGSHQTPRHWLLIKRPSQLMPITLTVPDTCLWPNCHSTHSPLGPEQGAHHRVKPYNVSMTTLLQQLEIPWATRSPPPLLLTMCYYTFAGVRFTCGHTMPIWLEWLVHPCEDMGCWTSLNHPQLCDGCMETCHTILNVNSSRILNHTSWECNPCRIYRAQQEGCTPICQHWVQIWLRIPHS